MTRCLMAAYLLTLVGCSGTTVGTGGTPPTASATATALPATTAPRDTSCSDLHELGERALIYTFHLSDVVTGKADLNLELLESIGTLTAIQRAVIDDVPPEIDAAYTTVVTAIALADQQFKTGGRPADIARPLADPAFAPAVESLLAFNGRNCHPQATATPDAPPEPSPARHAGRKAASPQARHIRPIFREYYGDPVRAALRWL